VSGELFRMNEHGDMWQEPTLFEQGGETPAPAGSGPVHFLAEWRRSGPDALGRIILSVECHGCRPDVGEGPRTFVARGLTEADAWRDAERLHTEHRERR